MNDQDSDKLFISESETFFNETIVRDDRILVQNWRFALEGILIPCIGIPGILGTTILK